VVGGAAKFFYSPGLRSALSAPQKPRRRAPLRAGAIEKIEKGG
jgi:hypothetical protein